jgi:uncharacterized protein with FMN-binding domain
MPKRGAVALLLTTGALALLLSFKTPSEVPGAAGDVAVAAVPSPTPAIVGTPAATAAPVATDPPAATAAPVATDPPATDPPATAAPGAAYRDGTTTGAAVGTRWGTVQVQVTISGGAITALQLPSNDRHSAQISSRAEPVLRSAALEAQSAEITVLSGATYTSLAYAQSLQSALDEARA